MLTASLYSGAAAERFERMVAGLGGPRDFLTRADAHLPAAPVVQDVVAVGDGVVAAIDVRAVGMAVVALGGGRTRPEDDVDPSVGFDRLCGIGGRVDRRTPLGRVHAQNAEAAEMGAARLRAAYKIGAEAAAPPLIVDELMPEGR
jgi:thymidine phosphorylase